MRYLDLITPARADPAVSGAKEFREPQTLQAGHHVSRLESEEEPDSVRGGFRNRRRRRRGLDAYPGKVPRLALSSSERQVSSHAQIHVARIIAARLPFSVGKRRKSTENLERKLLKLFRRRVRRETLNQ